MADCQALIVSFIGLEGLSSFPMLVENLGKRDFSEHEEARLSKGKFNLLQI